jgi:hypothetical protein
MSLAEDLLRHPWLPEAVRQFLQASHGAFLFGNTAPDVQVVSGQARQQTHYFSLPILPNDPPAWELILSEYPQLAEARQLLPTQSSLPGRLPVPSAGRLDVGEGNIYPGIRPAMHLGKLS